MRARIDPATVATGFELVLWLIGAALLWKWVLSPKARRERPAPALPRWDALLSEFILYLALALVGGLAAQMLALHFLKPTRLAAETQLILLNALFQTGMLAGVALYFRTLGRRLPGPPSAPTASARSGAAVLLLSLPVLTLVALVWQNLLALCKLPVEGQDVISLFLNARTAAAKAVLVVLAVCIAPMTEELIFRAGLFRYLRGRVPRRVALVGPALLFGALHVDWKSLDGLAAFAPLTVLGVILSLAYERTGRIGTAIVAHALFNLNTIVLLLAGVNV